MPTKAAIITILLLTAATAHAEPEIKGSPGELANYLNGVERPVTLEGHSDIKVQADRAIVKLSVKTEAPMLEAALKANQDIRRQMLEKLAKAGIDPNDVIASKFSSTPQYGFWSKRPKSYEVVNAVQIPVSNEKDFQVIASVVDSHEQVDYAGLSFEHSGKEQTRREAIAKACEDLMSKKAMYEKQLACRLYMKSFYEGQVADNSALLGGGLTGGYDKGYGYMYSGFATDETPPIAITGSEEAASFGEIKYTASVTAEFKLQID